MSNMSTSHAQEEQALHEEVTSSNQEKGMSSHEHACKCRRRDQSQEMQNLSAKANDLLDGVTKLSSAVRQNLESHPLAGVAGALVLGILFGQLIGRSKDL